MYIFKETEKVKVLQGRTIKYLAEEKLHITKEYLSQILSGKRGCSVRLANDIAKCICWDAKILDYFYKKGE
jgi:hypothetical protein